MPPTVIHSVMNGVPAEGWQLVQEPDRLAVQLAGVPDAFDDGLAGRLTSELQSRGALPPPGQCATSPGHPPHPAGEGQLIKRSSYKKGARRSLPRRARRVELVQLTLT